MESKKINQMEKLLEDQLSPKLKKITKSKTVERRDNKMNEFPIYNTVNNKESGGLR